MAQNKNRKNKKGGRNGNHEALGTLLIAISAFLLLCIIIKPILGIFSEAIFGILLGVFGIASYPVLLGLLLLGIFILRGKMICASKRAVSGIVFSALFLMIILQLATTHAFLDSNFTSYIEQTYSCKYSAGGILMGLLAFGLKALVTEIACYVIFSVAFIVTVVIASDAYHRLPMIFAGRSAKRKRKPEPEKPVEPEKPAGPERVVFAVPSATLFTTPIGPRSSDISTESGKVTDLPVTERRPLGDYGASPVMDGAHGKDRRDAFNVAKAKLYGDSDLYAKLSAEEFGRAGSVSPVESPAPRPPRETEEPVKPAKPVETFAPDEPSERVKSDAAKPKRTDYDGTTSSFDELYFPSEKNPQFNDIGIERAASDTRVPAPPPEPVRDGPRVTGVGDKPMYAAPAEDIVIFNASDSVNFTPEPEPEPEPIPEPEPELPPLETDEFKPDDPDDIINASEMNDLYKPSEPVAEEEPEEIEDIIDASAGFDPEAPKYVRMDESGIRSDGVVIDDSLIISDEPAIDLTEDHDNISDLLTGDDMSGIYEPVEEAPAPKPKRSGKNAPLENQMSIENMLQEQAEQSIVATQTRKYKKYDYVPPPIDLLKTYVQETHLDEEMQQNKEILERVVSKFLKTQVTVINIIPGPQVTMYEMDVPTGTAVNTIKTRAADITYELASVSAVRVQAPIPGKRAVGIEVPNRNRSIVGLREVVESNAFAKSKSPFVFSVGKDIIGNMVVCDLEKVPHLLIAGATGSGKSAGLSSLIISLLYKASPEDIRFILVDPKRVEFSKLRGMPHMLLENPIVDPNEALNALKWAATEMDRRYTILQKYACSKLTEYNSMPDVLSGKLGKLPHIVIVIDELANLMHSPVGSEIEAKISSLAALARAAGIHLIVATQRPSADVITGTIKANLTSRIAFKVQDATNSRIIIDDMGAEALAGEGDMLFFPHDFFAPLRVQGSFVTGGEVKAVIEYLKEHYESDFDSDAENAVHSKGGGENGGGEDGEGDNSLDPLTARVMANAIKTKQISVSVIQRRFSIGYARAARIVDAVENLGYIGPSTGNSKPREVRMTAEQYKSVFGYDPDEN